jgi:hypothetical protein
MILEMIGDDQAALLVVGIHLEVRVASRHEGRAAASEVMKT